MFSSFPNLYQKSPRSQPNIGLNHNLYSNTNLKFHTEHNPELNSHRGTNFENVKDTNLQYAVQKLIKQNNMLSQALQSQRQKNYQLLQLKRRLQDDVTRLEFQLQRMGTYDALTSKQCQIKRFQTMQDNSKLQAQLDQYFQQNKQIRGQSRKFAMECEQLAKQKEQLVNQNVILLNKIADMKTEMANYRNQISLLQHQLQQKSKRQMHPININPSLHEIVTLRSIGQNSHHQHHYSNPGMDSKQHINSLIINSPPQSPQSMLVNSPQNRVWAKNKQMFYRQEISTNPSQQKINLSSPSAKFQKHDKQAFGSFERIYQDFYEQNNAQPSPRSFSNQRIQQRLQFASPNRQFPINSQNVNVVTAQKRAQTIQISQKKSPSVFSYAHKQSPTIQPLPFTNNNNNNNNGKYIINLNTKNLNEMKSQDVSGQQMLQTYQKKQLKAQVQDLRNQIVDDLINKHYHNALQQAQKQKSNSLKLFIKQLQPKIQTLHQMVMNYLQARDLLSQSCPTLRLKWQPINPMTNPSYVNSVPANASEVLTRNTLNLSTIYSGIKQNARKDKSSASQYLTLFRYLTLLDKVQSDDIDQLLIQTIKHSALKQIHRICGQQTHNYIAEQDQ